MGLVKKKFMALYAIYSYEIQEGDRSLFYKETGKKYGKRNRQQSAE